MEATAGKNMLAAEAELNYYSCNTPARPGPPVTHATAPVRPRHFCLCGCTVAPLPRRESEKKSVPSSALILQPARPRQHLLLLCVLSRCWPMRCPVAASLAR